MDAEGPVRRFTRRRLLLAAAAVVLLGGGIGLAVWILRPPYHFAVVDPGVLLRSGQLTGRELERVRAETGLRTIIDLCGEKRDTFQAVEEREFARREGVRYVHLPVTSGSIPTGDAIPRFLEVLDDPANRPVLVHCWRGVKRTGVMVAILQMEYLGMDNEQALAELPAFGRELADFGDAEKDTVRCYIPRWRRVPSPSPPAR